MFMYCADNESEGLLPLADPPITELLLLLLITTETSWPPLSYNTVDSMYDTVLVSQTLTSLITIYFHTSMIAADTHKIEKENRMIKQRHKATLLPVVIFCN